MQVCWEKFNQYFEVEGRYVPVEKDFPVMSVDRIEQYADENTIGRDFVRTSPVLCHKRFHTAALLVIVEACQWLAYKLHERLVVQCSAKPSFQVVLIITVAHNAGDL